MKHFRKKPSRPPAPAPATPVSVGEDSAAGEEDPGAALDIDFAPPGRPPAAPGSPRTDAADPPVPGVDKP